MRRAVAGLMAIAAVACAPALREPPPVSNIAPGSSGAKGAVELIHGSGGIRRRQRGQPGETAGMRLDGLEQQVIDVSCRGNRRRSSERLTPGLIVREHLHVDAAGQRLVVEIDMVDPEFFTQPFNRTTTEYAPSALKIEPFNCSREGLTGTVKK